MSSYEFKTSTYICIAWTMRETHFSVLAEVVSCIHADSGVDAINEAEPSIHAIVRICKFRCPALMATGTSSRLQSQCIDVRSSIVGQSRQLSGSSLNALFQLVQVTISKRREWLGCIGLSSIQITPKHQSGWRRILRLTRAYPSETETLLDTCQAILGRPHKPNPLIPFFHPVGHISLDAETYEGSKLQTSLSDGILSLMNFFISEPLQNFGLGGAAMDYCERMARDSFGAKAITLATIAKEECLPDSPRRIAMKRPVPKITNQDWYARRGYVVYAAKNPGWVDIDEHGNKWPVKSVCMRKALV
ncbi:hypothetical protein GGR57DRAFT_176421 [Xylariaceae sp. FL1272]|nr:hypothetical protein GGR57DRAFT_176421 [Xylariaceae sp. FL1272]